MVMNCATLHVNAEGFGLENITVSNTFDYIHHNTDYANPQGFALTIAADGAVINDVTLYGNQDTLFFKSGRVYIANSLIEGNVDFIFGENNGLAFFIPEVTAILTFVPSISSSASLTPSSPLHAWNSILSYSFPVIQK